MKTSPSGLLSLLVVGTLLVGSCSGLGSAGESIALLATGGRGQVSTSVGTNEKKQAMQVVGSGLSTAVGAIGIGYVVLCAAAVLLALLLLFQGWPEPWQKGMAYVASGLTVARLALVLLEFEMLEQATEAMQASLRHTAGYSYQQAGHALDAATDTGSTWVTVIGLGVAVFWIITAFAFWTRVSGATAED